MNKLQFKPLITTIDEYDAFLFDLWGVVVEGLEIYPGVIDTINQIAEKKKVFFVSNAPRPKLNTFERLKSWGLHTNVEAIYTSGEVARDIILSSKESLKIDNPVIYHLGADRNFDIVADLNLNITEDIYQANILLLTLYRDEGENLNEFDRLLEIAAKNNIVCVCANPDTVIPNLGFKRYCSGYFAEKYEEMGGKVIYTGKPHLEIYKKLLDTLDNIPQHRILMIGDTLETDILGAKKAGIHSALVMSGNAEKFHLGYDNFEEKIARIYAASQQSGLVPSFITKLTL